MTEDFVIPTAMVGNVLLIAGIVAFFKWLLLAILLYQIGVLILSLLAGFAESRKSGFIVFGILETGPIPVVGILWMVGKLPFG